MHLRNKDETNRPSRTTKSSYLGRRRHHMLSAVIGVGNQRRQDEYVLLARRASPIHKSFMRTIVTPKPLQPPRLQGGL